MIYSSHIKSGDEVMRDLRGIVSRLAAWFILTVTACEDPLQVQRDYVSARDACSARSESQLGVYISNDSAYATDKDRNTLRIQLFCECMKGHEWNVGGCQKPKDVAKATPAPAPVPSPSSSSPAPSNAPTTVIVIQSPPGASSPPAIIMPGAPVTNAHPAQPSP